MPFQLTCLVTTYRAPRWLRLCLHALAADAARLPDPGTIELLVGDDGDEEHQSRPVVEEIARKGVFGAVRRFWQRRAGFGKCLLHEVDVRLHLGREISTRKEGINIPAWPGPCAGHGESRGR